MGDCCAHRGKCWGGGGGGCKRKVLPMRSSGLYSAMGLLTDLSRSWRDLTNVMGLGLLDHSGSPKSVS